MFPPKNDEKFQNLRLRNLVLPWVRAARPPDPCCTGVGTKKSLNRQFTSFHIGFGRLARAFRIP